MISSYVYDNTHINNNNDNVHNLEALLSCL